MEAWLLSQTGAVTLADVVTIIWGPEWGNDRCKEFLRNTNLLRELTSLRSIDLGKITFCNEETLLANLAFIPNLRVVKLPCCALSTCKFMAALPRVTTLDLSRNTIFDLNDVRFTKPSQIQHLSLSFNTIPDLEGLALRRIGPYLRDLTSLDVQGCPLLAGGSDTVASLGQAAKSLVPSLEIFCNREVTQSPSADPPHPQPLTTASATQAPANTPYDFFSFAPNKLDSTPERPAPSTDPATCGESHQRGSELRQPSPASSLSPDMFTTTRTDLRYTPSIPFPPDMGACPTAVESPPIRSQVDVTRDVSQAASPYAFNPGDLAHVSSGNLVCSPKHERAMSIGSPQDVSFQVPQFGTNISTPRLSMHELPTRATPNLRETIGTRSVLVAEEQYYARRAEPTYQHVSISSNSPTKLVDEPARSVTDDSVVLAQDRPVNSPQLSTSEYSGHPQFTRGKALEKKGLSSSEPGTIFNLKLPEDLPKPIRRELREGGRFSRARDVSPTTPSTTSSSPVSLIGLRVPTESLLNAESILKDDPSLRYYLEKEEGSSVTKPPPSSATGVSTASSYRGTPAIDISVSSVDLNQKWTALSSVLVWSLDNKGALAKEETRLQRECRKQSQILADLIIKFRKMTLAYGACLRRLACASEGEITDGGTVFRRYAALQMQRSNLLIGYLESLLSQPSAGGKAPDVEGVSAEWLTSARALADVIYKRLSRSLPEFNMLLASLIFADFETFRVAHRNSEAAVSSMIQDLGLNTGHAHALQQLVASRLGGGPTTGRSQVDDSQTGEPTTLAALVDSQLRDRLPPTIQLSLVQLNVSLSALEGEAYSILKSFAFTSDSRVTGRMFTGGDIRLQTAELVDSESPSMGELHSLAFRLRQSQEFALDRIYSSFTAVAESRVRVEEKHDLISQVESTIIEVSEKMTEMITENPTFAPPPRSLSIW